MHYFVGYEHGLCESDDGKNWDAVATFSGVRCMDMANGNHDVFALACDYDENNVFMSYDDGNTWEQKMFPAQFFEIAFAGYYSRPVGVCNGILGGLYELEEGNWEVLYYSLAIQALGHSSYTDPYIGWYTGMPPDIGIAGFDFHDPNAGIQYVYEGLPNTNVFSIAEISVLTVGGQWVCCCTDEGAFISYGIDVGLDELSNHTGEIQLYPNPVAGKLHISPSPEDLRGEFSLIDMEGNQVLKKVLTNDVRTIEMQEHPPGVYIATIHNSAGTVLYSEKIIKL